MVFETKLSVAQIDVSVNQFWYKMVYKGLKHKFAIGYNYEHIIATSSIFNKGFAKKNNNI